MMKYLVCIFLLVLFSECKPKENNTVIQFAGKPEIPSSIQITHVLLLEQIHKMTLYKDSSGRVAIKIEDMMKHHFTEEENYILPTLGLLPLLANGQIPQQYDDVILLSEKAKSLMDHMSAEHQLITAYIKELKDVSNNDNLSEIIDFENQVSKHAISEEEVLFPAAILVGEYLKLKSAPKP